MGGINDYMPRTVVLDFGFLEANAIYTADLFLDGPNADRSGTDYQHLTRKLAKGDVLNVSMAPGGGLTVKLEKIAN